jgi:hypothetical protein
MIKDQSNYSASFTAGALLFQEIKSVIELLKQDDFIELLDKERGENKFLKIKTENARIRVTTEIKKRARSVDKVIWEFFETCVEKEQRLLLFYVLLKSSPLAMDYHFEVSIKKWRRYNLDLSKFDIQMRLDELSSFDEEVASWSESTKTKTITQYIRTLREAGLMRGNTLSQVDIMNNQYWEHYMKWGDEWFLEACFLNRSEREALI